MERVVAVFAIVMGLAVAGMWTDDLLRGRVDLSRGVTWARDGDSGSLLLPHWVAGYGTAAALVVGGVRMLVGAGWATVVTGVGLGACAYTSVNSLGWALALPERRPYAVPMVVGALGSVVGVVVLLAA